MKKTKISTMSYVSLIFVFLSVSNAKTNISGVIASDVIWTKTNSPYIITGNTIINKGVTLTIESGVTIKFDTLKIIQIDGILIARGSASDTINFTSNSTVKKSGYWGCLHFTDLSADAVFDSNGNYKSGSIVEYSNIEYGGGLEPFITNYDDRLQTGSIIINNASPYINKSKIHDNNSRAITCTNNSSPVIKSNMIFNNQAVGYGTTGSGGGILGSKGDVLIDNNSLFNNSAGKNSGYGGGAIYIGSGKARISNNIISKNISGSSGIGGGGILVNDWGNAVITNNIFFENEGNGSFGGGAIYQRWGQVEISKNMIIQNRTTGSNGGGGIYMDDGGTSKIKNNIFYKNFAKIGGGFSVASDRSYDVTMENNSFIEDSAQDASSMYYQSSDGKNITKNLFFANKCSNSNSRTIAIKGYPNFNNNNIFVNTAKYDLSNGNSSSSTKLNSKYNWWGLSDDTKIQSQIFDWVDDGTKSIVDYSGFLLIPDTSAPISPPTDVKYDIEPGKINVSWTLNPEKDLAGYNMYYGNSTGYSFSEKIKVGSKNSFVLSYSTLPEVIAITAYDSNADGQDDQYEGHESWYSQIHPKNAVTNLRIHNQQEAFKPNLTLNKFSFTLDEKINVKLNIFDTAGKHRQNLLNSILFPGNHYFEIKDLPNGMYFIKAVLGENTQTFPFILTNK